MPVMDGDNPHQGVHPFTCVTLYKPWASLTKELKNSRCQPLVYRSIGKIMISISFKLIIYNI